MQLNEQRGLDSRETYLIQYRKRAGQLLKKKREEKGFTHEQFADFVDTSPETIRRIEQGFINDFGLILRIANTLGIDIFFSVRPQ
jgi:transcriptional regulator with XRE-family HTH domain